MRLVSAAFAALLLVASGCAHHQASPYAFQPPLAPPVYPQPQQPTPPTVSYAPGAMPTTAVVPGPVTQAGAVVASDPCCQPGEGMPMATPVVYDAEQSPPCPPGP